MTITTKTKKIIYVLVFISPVIIILLLKTPLKNQNTKTATIPTTNLKETEYKYAPKNIYSIDSQKTTLNLRNASNKITNESQKIYKITNSLVSENYINSFISNLNFYEVDRINDTPEGDFLWVNKSGSLFFSNSQQQIVYMKKDELQNIPNIILSEEDVKNTGINYIQKLFGETTIKTLSKDVKINYLYKNPEEIESEPKNTNYNNANIITISFKQQIDDMPVITDSPNTEILRITINKNKDIVDLRVYGGFLNIKEVKKTVKPSLSNIDTTKLRRISYASDISSEKYFSNTKELTINVDNIYNAYYHQNNDFLSPIIVFEGEMRAGKLTEPATFIYPIEPSSESL